MQAVQKNKLFLMQHLAASFLRAANAFLFLFRMAQLQAGGVKKGRAHE